MAEEKRLDEVKEGGEFFVGGNKVDANGTYLSGGNSEAKEQEGLPAGEPVDATTGVMSPETKDPPKSRKN